MSARWTWALANSTGGNLTDGFMPLAAERTITFQHNQPAVATCKLPLTSADAAAITPGSTYLKAYREIGGVRTLRFYGPVWLDEVQGSNGMDWLSIVAMDPTVYLTRRYTTAAFTSTDQGTILKTLIDTANAETETGIRTSSSNIVASKSINLDNADNKPTIADVRGQFAEQLDGCDSWIVPIEYADGKICDLHVASVRGAIRNGAVFGYGAGTAANCTAMTRARNMDEVANDVYGFNDASAANWVDTTSINTYRRLEADISFTGETDATVLAARTRFHLDRHLDPDQVATYAVTCGPRAPRLFDDFDIGDVVPLQLRKGAISFETQQRVHAATIAISNNGLETFSSLETKAIV